ncbi:ABC transporter permease [Microbispora sp. NPDC046933]|uniref:ABC transporter permease n=1 Tax=Microbispora sp. NPDC046933 TaxID=3155618 RepID=UPI0034001941
MSTAQIARSPALVKRLARHDLVLSATMLLCAILILLALVGPFVTPYPPDQTDILAAGQGPSALHPLGTDSLGRDLLSRLLAGARPSLLFPAITVLISSVLGTAIAIAAAWHGGRVDQVTARVLEIMFAVPGILVAVIGAAVLGTGPWMPVVTLSLVYIPYVARVVRSAAVRECRLPYVEACRLAGLSGWRICTRHVLRNVAPLTVAQATLAFGWALMDFGAISFLGLGVQPPQAEWGVMVNEGRPEMLDGALQQSLSAGLLIVLAVVTFNILGERLSARIGAST